MNRLHAIAWATFGEILRQPAYLLLGAGGVVFLLVLSHLTYFGLGEEVRQVRMSVLAFLLLAGCVSAVWSASTLLGRELASGTALLLLTKPVGRMQLLGGKYLGLAGSLALQVGIHLFPALLAAHFAERSSGNTDGWGVVVILAPLGLALLGASATSYLARRSFVKDAVLGLALGMPVAFLILWGRGVGRTDGTVGTGVDWALLPAIALILGALLALGGFALALSTRLPALATLVAVGVWLALGLLSDHWFGTAARSGSRLATVVHALVPNWQHFWIADALDSPRPLPRGYLGGALLYALAHTALALGLGCLLFRRREVS